MTIGDDSEQPVDKCRKMNENNPTVHTALFSMADSSASSPNELDDLLPIHEQEFAMKNMQKFHKSMNMKILQCSICCEAWPVKASVKNSSKDHTCKRCKVDKKELKKFSKENCMIPSTVLDELKNLTECEQMLISRAFPIMQVYMKPGLGYLDIYQTLSFCLNRISENLSGSQENLHCVQIWYKIWFCWEFEVLSPGYVTINQNFSPIPQSYRPNPTILAK